MQVNKKLLQQHLNEKTGKTVTLKDISNIQSRMNSGIDGSDIDCLVTRLRAITGMLKRLTILITLIGPLSMQLLCATITIRLYTCSACSV